MLKDYHSEFAESREVAHLLGVSPSTLNRWGRLRKGPPRIKIGRRSLYRRDRLRTWLIAQEEDLNA